MNSLVDVPNGLPELSHRPTPSEVLMDCVVFIEHEIATLTFVNEPNASFL